MTDTKKEKTRRESTPVKVWVTPAEKAAIAEKAAAHSMSASRYLRALGLALTRLEKCTDAYLRLPPDYWVHGFIAEKESSVSLAQSSQALPDVS